MIRDPSEKRLERNEGGGITRVGAGNPGVSVSYQAAYLWLT